MLPEFTVTQHQRDIQVLYALKSFFQCGVVRVNSGYRYCYRVRNREHLSEIIIPFFEKHKLKTMKRVNFEKFRRVLLMMKQGHHLHLQGLSEISKIQAEMNRKGTDLRESPAPYENKGVY